MSILSDLSAALLSLCRYRHNTNNNAERPLRPAKLHDKISECFRNPTNAASYATLLSYIGTAAKHGRNLHETLVELFTTGPWHPADAIPG